jgi:hypothetical protein
MNTNAVQGALSDYARGRMMFAEFKERVADAVTLDLAPGGSADIEYRMRPLPRVTLRVDDVRSALQRFNRGDLSSEELAAWASVMSLLDSFVLECPDPGERTVIWNILEALSVPLVSGAHKPRAITKALKTLDRIRKPSPAG